MNGYSEIYNLLIKTAENKASDLHLSVGMPPTLRINGRLIKQANSILTQETMERYISSILNKKQMEFLQKNGDIDVSILVDNHRFRVNIFMQKGLYSAAFRYLYPDISDFESLGLPDVLIDICKQIRGLVLVTGATGTGKSTTLAAMIDWINTHRECHIITLEEPIEYLHRHKKSIVNQREIGEDSKSFSSALRAALRQDPDVILVGEMRDLDSISITITAAETGHLVFSTLHTLGTSNTIDRVIDVFPPYQQQQIRTQLAQALLAVISQQLVPSIDNQKRYVATEVMIATPAIRNLIRENKIHQIGNAILTSGKNGMITMDNSLVELYKSKKISIETALNYAMDTNYIKKALGI
jgi:twitching motility protein PilT